MKIYRKIDKYLLLLLLLSGLVVFLNLGSGNIQVWDEATNISVVKESQGFLLTGDRGYFFEKPPLWYWASGLLQNIFGEKLWVYRLISALSGIGIAIVSYLFLKKKISRLVAFLCASSFLLIAQNFWVNVGGYFSTHTYRSADLDALQILFIFSSFCLIHTDKKYWIFSCILLGLGFLSKGPLVLIFLFINSLYLFGSTGSRKKYMRQFLLGVGIFMLIVIPWHLYMYLSFKNEFLEIYLNYHLINRVNEALEGHRQPWWYYFKIFFDIRVNVLWPIFLLAIFNPASYSQVYVKYSLFIILVLFVLLGFVGTKLAWYMLPIYPFLCLTIAPTINQFVLLGKGSRFSKV